MTSALSVYNQALSASHAKGRLASLSENSREREVCELWYGSVRKLVQEAAYWPGCKAVDHLALISSRTEGTWSSGQPAPPYSFKYALPANYLRAWHLASYMPFDIYYDNSISRNVLVTDDAEALLFYALDQEEVGAWTPGQVMATVYGLAAHIVGPLSGERFLIQKNLQMANTQLQDAKAMSYNSSQQVLQSIPPQLMARGYRGSVPSPRFYYPLGSVFALDNVRG